jgi:hypothetical protein
MRNCDTEEIDGQALLVLLLFPSPALALDQSQIQAACYTACEKENQSKPDY